MTEKTLSFEELGITAADVYEQMGYHDAQPDKATQQETAMILKEVSQWLRPQFSYFVVNKQPDFEMGNIILRQLRGSEAFALFICTSGLCADQMEKALQESIDKLGWMHTNRFSPGYCGWHVSQQQLLFPLFQGHTCGVKLTDSSLMIPIKSVSGIIGLGEKVRKLEYTCGLCDFKQCYKRKKKA